MVKAKEKPHIESNGSIIPEVWLHALASKRPQADLHLVRRACELNRIACSSVDETNPCIQQGLAMAEVLLDLELDQEALAAAISYAAVRMSDLQLDIISEQLNPRIAKLVRGVIQMDGVRNLHGLHTNKHSQAENLRKMLLAMVEDVRVVLIKLAEYACLLRTASQLDDEPRMLIAKETLDIYAPLANRLGIGQLKWEMEDLAFRYLDPIIYKKLAKLLDARRLDRERYIQQVVNDLQMALTQAEITEAQVHGRAKHIYSIYRKMQRKSVSYEEIYDISAVRVLVPKLEDCYTVLGLVHGLWQQIPEEFDDYIAAPKENGYRSIHTAVLGPQQKNVEVQIRTYTMHEESELGVAAHWRYKEGGGQATGYEAKIAWLRQVLAWRQEWAEPNEVEIKKHHFDDRIYIFTPEGEIIDMPRGATPLDFAYYLHSEIGHRCRGAKINGAIVPLTYTLNTGEQVEILTTKSSNPSRDWLSPHLGYLQTARARAKVHHWFKQRDVDKNAVEGQSLLDKEIRRLGLPYPNLNLLAEQLHYKTSKEMLAAIGCGDLRIAHLCNLIQPVIQAPDLLPILPVMAQDKAAAGNINIQGVGKLLTTMARCCRPIPGDAIVGFITQGRGVSIHRSDCNNILAMDDSKQTRLISVNWGDDSTGGYPVDIMITAFDRQGLTRDITALFTAEKMNLIGMRLHIDDKQNTAHIQATIEIKRLADLSRLMDRLHQVPNIMQVERRIT